MRAVRKWTPERFADIRELIDLGESVERAAERSGVTLSNLARSAFRHGHNDLAQLADRALRHERAAYWDAYRSANRDLLTARVTAYRARQRGNCDHAPHMHIASRDETWCRCGLEVWQGNHLTEVAA